MINYQFILFYDMDDKLSVCLKLWLCFMMFHKFLKNLFPFVNITSGWMNIQKIIFVTSEVKIILWYSLESPRRGIPVGTLRICFAAKIVPNYCYNYHIIWSYVWKVCVMFAVVCVVEFQDRCFDKSSLLLKCSLQRLIALSFLFLFSYKILQHFVFSLFIACIRNVKKKKKKKKKVITDSHFFIWLKNTKGILTF